MLPIRTFWLNPFERANMELNSDFTLRDATSRLLETLRVIKLRMFDVPNGLSPNVLSESSALGPRLSSG